MANGIQVITAPGAYVQGAGAIGQLAARCRALGERGAYLILGKTARRDWGREAGGGFCRRGLPLRHGRFRRRVLR